jgi:hypothetical protein
MGADMGGLFDLNHFWRLHAYARSLRYFMGQRDTPWSVGVDQHIVLGRDLALRVELARNRELERSYSNGSVSMLFYF